MLDQDDQSRQLLRHAAAAAADVADGDGETGPPTVGAPGYWRRDPRAWEQTTFLDTIQHEYGLVARWWLVGIREAAIVGLAFWLVAFVIGLVLGERSTMTVGSAQVDLVWVALAIALVIRGLVHVGVLLVRRER